MKENAYKAKIPIIADDLIGLTSSTDFSKITEKMYSIDNIKMITDLSDKSIGKLIKLYAFAEEYELPMLRDLSDTFIELRVSKDRQGRGEAVSMAQAILGMKKLDMLEKYAEQGMGKK